MDSEQMHDYSVALVGFIFVVGILYVAFSSPVDVPSGYLAAAGVTNCCMDCSCPTQEICSGCARCVWTWDCQSLKEDSSLGVMELVNVGRVEDNSTFMVNVVLYPKEDGKRLVELTLPNGFSSDRDSFLATLYSGERMIIPFKVHVGEDVAEQEHTIKVELVDADFQIMSSVETEVSVYWNR
jgi:hypothetical protein